MPSAGAPWRGEQLAMLATQLHARQSAEAYADLVGTLDARLHAFQQRTREHGFSQVGQP